MDRIGRSINIFRNHPTLYLGVKALSNAEGSFINATLCINTFLKGKLKSQIASFVGYYNKQRYHESLDNLTPADVYFGITKKVLTKREEIKERNM